MRKYEKLERLAAFALAAVMLLAENANVVFATERQEQMQCSVSTSIMEAVRDFYEDESLAMGARRSVGQAIQAYECIDGKLNELSFDLYPVFDGESVVATVTVYETDAGEEIAQVDAGNHFDLVAMDRVALLFDRKACYCIGDSGLRKVYDFMEEVETRSFLVETNLQYNGLEIVEVTPGDEFVLESYEPNRLELTYSCTVIHVKQTTNSNCWAATLTCIENCLLGRNSDPLSIEDVFGNNTNMSFGRSVPDACDVFNDKCDHGYSYQEDYGPSASIVVTNLSNGWPMYVHFSGVVDHACAAYYINVTSGYIKVMDPAFEASSGWRTCYSDSNGQYSYYGSNGILYTASGYVAKYI